MSSWNGSSRSNYFKVKDQVAFKEEMESLDGIEVVTSKNHPGCVALLVCNNEDGGWPRWESTGSDDDEDVEIDLPARVSKHLVKNQIAIFMTAGAEKLRYISGSAEAVDHAGKVVSLSLYDIYDLAAKAFKRPRSAITEASY